MAIGKKTGGRDFKKGHPCVTDGRPPLTLEVRQAKQLTTEEFIRTFNDLFYKDVDELDAISKDRKEIVLRAYMAKCLWRGRMCGDYWTLNLMMDRIIGKVREPVSPDQENTLKELLAAMIGAAKGVSKDKEKKNES